MTARWRVALVTVGVLLALDAGRSLWARLGYARPVEVWQPDARVYADLAWPPGVDLPADAPLGRRLYAQRCAVCHGPDGRGNGPAAPSLIPRPVDFVRGQFKYKSTPGDRPPTDADLVRVVTDGLQASAMPYFGDLLTPAEIRAVVDYVKGLSAAFSGPAPSRSPSRRASHPMRPASPGGGISTPPSGAGAATGPTDGAGSGNTMPEGIP